jgi:hypothetical protein
MTFTTPFSIDGKSSPKWFKIVVVVIIARFCFEGQETNHFHLESCSMRPLTFCTTVFLRWSYGHLEVRDHYSPALRAHGTPLAPVQ